MRLLLCRTDLQDGLKDNDYVVEPGLPRNYEAIKDAQYAGNTSKGVRVNKKEESL